MFRHAIVRIHKIRCLANRFSTVLCKHFYRARLSRFESSLEIKMPTFESIIVGAPAGFNQSCNDLNKLAIVDPQLLETIVKKSLLNVNYVPSDPQELKYQNEIKTVNFIIRSFKAASPAPTFPQMASALDQNSLLTRDCVEKIIVAIQENSGDQSQSANLLSQVCISDLYKTHIILHPYLTSIF